MNQKNVLSEMPQRNPINGTFELTVRCNLKCKMCLFRHDDSENAEIMEKELTTEQWIDMARQVADAGTISLLITGGEPMLRADFCEIWEGIYKQGFIMELYTNATLITPKIQETLKKYPPHRIGITIYGGNSDTYKMVCGSSRAFERMIDGAHFLTSLPSEVEFRTTLIKDNVQDIELMDELVKKEFGNSYFIKISSNIHQSVRGACADVNTCRLMPDEMHDIKISRMIRKAGILIGDTFDPNALKFVPDEKGKIQECKTTKLSLLGCKAGMSSYAVSWDGKLLACQVLGTFNLDILTVGFSRAWELFPGIVKLPSKSAQCENCDVAMYCQTCVASRIAETGSFSGCCEYIRKDAEVNKNFIKKIKENCYETVKL